MEIIKLSVSGRVPSKKNSKQIIMVRGRPLIISSKDHKSWHGDALKQLRSQNLPPTSLENVKKVSVVVYGENKRKFDLSNKVESIMDLLVDAKILLDDNYEVVPHLEVIYGGIKKENPGAEIEILLQELQ